MIVMTDWCSKKFGDILVKWKYNSVANSYTAKVFSCLLDKDLCLGTKEVSRTITKAYFSYVEVAGVSDAITGYFAYAATGD